MKKLSLLFVLTFCTINLYAQENRITIFGGYAFENLDDLDEKATGFRITGLYEYNPQEGKVAHGVGVGFVSVKATDETFGTTEPVEYKITHWPIYYAPKIMFGKDRLKIYIKGAIGSHISKYKREGYLGDLSYNDFGFYAGSGGGIIIHLSDKLFITGDYEWAWMSGTSYDGKFLNSASGGLGIIL